MDDQYTIIKCKNVFEKFNETHKYKSNLYKYRFLKENETKCIAICGNCVYNNKFKKYMLENYQYFCDCGGIKNIMVYKNNIDLLTIDKIMYYLITFIKYIEENIKIYNMIDIMYEKENIVIFLINRYQCYTEVYNNLEKSFNELSEWLAHYLKHIDISLFNAKEKCLLYDTIGNFLNRSNLEKYNYKIFELLINFQDLLNNFGKVKKILLPPSRIYF